MHVLDNMTDADRRLYMRIPDEVDYMPHESFSRPGIEEKLFGQAAEKIQVPRWDDYPEAAEGRPLKSVKRQTLSRADEAGLFMRYNYARYRLSLLAAARMKNPAVAEPADMVRWFKRAMACRADLVRANLPLVVAMAKRTRIPNVEFAELISEGNMALLRCVEKFDVTRGFKFSTYACRAILKSFNRLATTTGKYHHRFPAEFKPEMERSDYDVKKHEMRREYTLESLREILASNKAELSPVERQIVMDRFAMGPSGRRMTLAEVGESVGLTNERVRQIQNTAIRKLRATLEEEYLLP